jgi:hypothetical protein
MGKYSWLVILVGIFLTSCGILYVPVTDTEYEVPIVESIPGAIKWIEKNIKYKGDVEQYGYEDYWASPGETVASGYGDCEDMAILFLYMVYVNFGERGTLDILLNKERTRAHAVGVTDNYRFYDVDGLVILKYSLMYEDAMSRIGQKASRSLDDVDYLVVD